MAINNLVKRLQNIMRQDAGVNGDAQRIEQMVWIFSSKSTTLRKKYGNVPKTATISKVLYPKNCDGATGLHPKMKKAA